MASGVRRRRGLEPEEPCNVRILWCCNCCSILGGISDCNRPARGRLHVHVSPLAGRWDKGWDKGWYKLHVLGWDKGWYKPCPSLRLPGWDSFAVCPRRVRGRDIAPPGHTTALGPRLEATANALSVPAPPASKLCIGQFGTPTWLSAEPGDRLLFFERPDWPNVVGRGIGISLRHVHPLRTCA